MMNPVWIFCMTSIWVTPSLIEIQISEAIELWKAEAWSYPIYTLIYTLVMQIKVTYTPISTSSRKQTGN